MIRPPSAVVLKPRKCQIAQAYRGVRRAREPADEGKNAAIEDGLRLDVEPCGGTGGFGLFGNCRPGFIGLWQVLHPRCFAGDGQPESFDAARPAIAGTSRWPLG